MPKKHAVLTGPLLISLLGVAFSLWSAFGNDVNICVTTGCNLYQDFTIANISLWWYGAGAFTILTACAILGQASIGLCLAFLFLLGDICLLLLMAFTAPCVSCLLVALLFALNYHFFRKQNRQTSPRFRHSIALWVWLALFIVNLGQVARSQLDIWPILDESGEAKLRMFFSPSCRYCVEGINALSGNIDTAFYPLAENEADIAKIEKMSQLLQNGASMADAMAECQDAAYASFWQGYSPDTLLLRFRLLRNKAHVFSQGSQGVPFFERKGLPPDIAALSRKRDRSDAPAAPPQFSTDPTLPAELLDGGQCGGVTPCPPGQQP